jgi:nucleoid DNA-binding protein
MTCEIHTQSIKLGLTCKGNYSKGFEVSKLDYVERICQDNRPRGLSKKVIKDIVDETFTFILQSLEEDKKFTYPGFGSFRLKNRKQRQGTNPNTGEKITIASRKAISFTVSEKLKKTLR